MLTQEERKVLEKYIALGKQLERKRRKLNRLLAELRELLSSHSVHEN